jgi:hypothetical protein
VWAHCNLPLGAVYTIVHAKGGLSGTFAGIANGAVLQATADGTTSCQASRATAPWLKYGYNDVNGTFTAKVVAPPPGVSSPSAPAAGPYNVAGAGGQAALAR